MIPTLDGIQDKSWKDQVSPQDLSLLDDQLNIAKQELKTVTIDLHTNNQRGQRRTIRITATPVLSESGSAEKMIGIASDITRSHYIENLLEQKSKIAKLAQKEFL